jgi:hypothetical protein
LPEEKQRNQLAQTEFRCKKIRLGRRQLLFVLGLHISFALQQETANFKAALASRPMQWSAFTEGKQKNKLAS